MPTYKLNLMAVTLERRNDGQFGVQNMFWTPPLNHYNAAQKYTIPATEITNEPIRVTASR
ncbi:hypothetical protein JCM14076_22210 [Methylosoma difficile]